jgi:hypothetical protein
MIKTEISSPPSGVGQQQDWQLLFNMLPEIKQTKSFGRLVGSKRMPDGNMSVPFWLENEIVSKVFNTAYLLGIVLVFDWASWQEGIDILNNPDADFNQYNLETLCKLLTFIVRCDKFCEGYMINSFETGRMARILEAMEAKVNAFQLL